MKMYQKPMTEEQEVVLATGVCSAGEPGSGSVAGGGEAGGSIEEFD